MLKRMLPVLCVTYASSYPSNPAVCSSSRTCLSVCADTSEDMTDGLIKLKPFDYTLANVDHDSDGSRPKEELAEDVVLHMVKTQAFGDIMAQYLPSVTTVLGMYIENGGKVVVDKLLTQEDDNSYIKTGDYKYADGGNMVAISVMHIVAVGKLQQIFVGAFQVVHAMLSEHGFKEKINEDDFTLYTNEHDHNFLTLNFKFGHPNAAMHLKVTDRAIYLYIED